MAEQPAACDRAADAACASAGSAAGAAHQPINSADTQQHLSPHAVIIFARLPVIGKVKTRLGRTLGSSEAATDFYSACAEHTLRQMHRGAGMRVSVYCASAEEAPGMRSWLESLNLEFKVAPQLDVPDLGLRMRAALEAELQHASKVVLFGTDIPDVTPSVVSAALTAVGSDCQLALGPAADGGFYCIGVAAPLPESFLQGLTWSTERVFSDTVQQAATLGMAMAPKEALPRLADIDTAQDLRDWVAQAPGDHPLQAAARQALTGFLPAQ